jgi:hypothetical protein
MASIEQLRASVTPSKGHEKRKTWVGALVETYALERGITMSGFGEWLLIDPDDRITVPDFVIEVQWSRTARDKLEIYKRLGVREVWFWAKSNEIIVHVLRRGRWSVVDRSPCLPDLDLALLCSFFDRPSMTQAMLDFRAALRGA